ncbi:MAG: homogentisate 1,2-dioxygenase [Candidatus Rokubacteria bacterium]|nr:homogentisate 1,2-dioxygenase [Candidatus Rokubacteria bacterium]
MFPQIKGHVTKQAHVGIPPGTYEEEHARRGFFGRTSHLYHLHPPTAWVRVEGPLRPRLILGERVVPADLMDSTAAPTALFENDDAVVSISRRSQAMPFYFRNGDGDEVHFVHRGLGRYETDYGPLAYEPGDYLWIPKGTTYRVVPEVSENFLLIVETREFVLPDRGLMGQHAFIDPAMLETPDPAPHAESDGEWEVRVRRERQLTSFFYRFHPLDVVGWKGELMPVRFNVRDLRPVVSARYHMPPTVHATFSADPCTICTFAPRPFESDAESQRLPFYHRNIDYDELLFYHAGEFMSRHGIGPGAFTLHPQGIHHGPHPKAFETIRQRQATNEVAVLVETTRPLRLSAEAEKAEDPAYATNWAQ